MKDSFKTSANLCIFNSFSCWHPEVQMFLMLLHWGSKFITVATQSTNSLLLPPWDSQVSTAAILCLTTYYCCHNEAYNLLKLPPWGSQLWSFLYLVCRKSYLIMQELSRSISWEDFNGGAMWTPQAKLFMVHVSEWGRQQWHTGVHTGWYTR